MKNDISQYGFCLIFLLKIDDSNYEEHQEIILNSNYQNAIYHFAKEINKSDKEKLFIRMLEVGNQFWIKLFLKNVNFNKERFKDLLIFL